MSEPHTPSGAAPPADAVKEHVKKAGEETDLGAGNQEADPATAENPPADLGAGDVKREASESEASRANRMDTGVSREKNVDPESPAMHSGDQGS